MTTSLDRSGDVPLWRQVLDRLEEAIARGDYADRLPTELELTDMYGVSRHTVREAMRRLQDKGIVVRTQGRGTSLRTVEVGQPLGALYSLFRTVEAQGLEQRSHVLDFGLAPNPEAATRLGLPEDTPLTHLRRVRLAGGEPLAIDETWLLPELWDGLAGSDFSHTALYIELRDRCGMVVSGGSETIAPGSADRSEARLLGVRTGAPIFVVERLGRAAGRPVEYRKTVLRGDRFVYRAEWSDGAAQVAPAWDLVGATPG